MLSEYDIEKYGQAVFSDNPRIKNGNFRRTRSLMPFEYIDKTSKDFNWDIYGKDAPELNRKLSIAFVVNFSKFQKEGKLYNGTGASRSA